MTEEQPKHPLGPGRIGRGDAGAVRGAAGAGADVRKIQQALTAAGIDPGGIDGKLGPATAKALSEFQQVAGLPETGKPDEQTVALLLRPASSGRPELFLYRDPDHPLRRHLLSDYGPPPGPDSTPPAPQGKA